PKGVFPAWASWESAGPGQLDGDRAFKFEVITSPDHAVAALTDHLVEPVSASKRLVGNWPGACWLIGWVRFGQRGDPFEPGHPLGQGRDEFRAALAQVCGRYDLAFGDTLLPFEKPVGEEVVVRGGGVGHWANGPGRVGGRKVTPYPTMRASGRVGATNLVET